MKSGSKETSHFTVIFLSAQWSAPPYTLPPLHGPNPPSVSCCGNSINDIHKKDQIFQPLKCCSVGVHVAVVVVVVVPVALIVVDVDVSEGVCAFQVFLIPRVLMLLLFLLSSLTLPTFKNKNK